MAGLVIIGFALIVFLAIFAWFWWKPAGRDQRRLWKSMSREQRKRIYRAMRRGEAVSDPRDAALAVEWAKNARALRGGPFHLPLAVDLTLAALLILGVVLTQEWVRLVEVAFLIGAVLAARMMMRWMYRRVDAALLKNRELAKQLEGTSGLRGT